MEELKGTSVISHSIADVATGEVFNFGNVEYFECSIARGRSPTTLHPLWVGKCCFSLFRCSNFRIGFYLVLNIEIETDSRVDMEFLLCIVDVMWIGMAVVL